MSAEHKFFDEKTQTLLVGKYGFMTRLESLVNLEAEIHVVNLRNEAAGTFRVVWVNTQSNEGFHQLGVEAVEAPDDMWGIYFPPVEPSTNEPGSQVWLACKKCNQKELGTVPQAELEYLDVGVLVARQCEKCKATTTWEYLMPAGVASDEEKNKDDKRAKIRSKLKLTVKLIREQKGGPVEDVCRTIDVSHIGAYFLTSQDYQAGQVVKVVMPYKKDGLGTPVAARVIRIDSRTQSPHHAVAVQFDTAISAPELGPELAGAELAAQKKAQKELRTKGRVPLKMPIKVTRQVYGMTLDDLTETVNISRTGAYFRSTQNYTLGENVQVILPYKRGEQFIPAVGRIVRMEEIPGTKLWGVAVHIAADKK
jgi:hypothetical protein